MHTDNLTAACDMMAPDHTSVGPFEEANVVPMQIDFRQLHQFLAVVDAKGFTAAAEKLNMTQPALTRSVQQIEERFGVKLIDRGAKTFQLTAFGRMLAERARLIQKEFAHIDAEMTALKSGETGTLRIGTGPSGASYLSSVLFAYREQLPNVKVSLVFDSMDANLAALLNGELDLICTALEFPRHPTLHCESVVSLRNVVVASKNHPLARRNIVEPEDMLAYRWVAFAKDNMANSRISAFFAANELNPPQVAFETNSLDMMFATVADSDLLACVPPLVIDAANDRGLTTLNLKGSFWDIRLGFAHLRTAHLPSALAKFITILRGQLVTLKADNRYIA